MGHGTVEELERKVNVDLSVISVSKLRTEGLTDVEFA